MKKIGFIVVLALVLAGCRSEQPQPSSLVLEGWIDANGFPVVLIHKSLVFAAAPDSVRQLEDIIADQLIPFGKVVVSDGEQEVILTGSLDTAYMPPYKYTSVNMVGQPGRSYTVTVHYKEFNATSTTTIPPVATLDSLGVKADSTGQVSVRGYMSGIEGDSYYALFLREYGQKQFKLCPLGVFDSSVAVEGQIVMPVTNPLAKSDKMYNEHLFHQDSTTYQLKVARIDYASYCFWQAYNEHILTAGVLFMPVYKNLPTNIEGGIGNFSGLGSTIYTFSTSGSRMYRF